MDTLSHGGRGAAGRTRPGPRDSDDVGIGIGIGCEVVIRSIRAEGESDVQLPAGLHGDRGEQVVTIAADMGLYRVTVRTPLGRALLGARVGDVVTVRSQAATVAYEVLAIDRSPASMKTDARVAELADAAVLKTAPEKGPGSNPGAGTTTTALDTMLSGEHVAETGRPVQVGDVVDVRDGELEEWWRVVPHVEADAARRCISDQSPLGRALLGHRAGEVVAVRPPAVHGVRGPSWPVRILAVKPAWVPA